MIVEIHRAAAFQSGPSIWTKWADKAPVFTVKRMGVIERVKEEEIGCH